MVEGFYSSLASNISDKWYVLSSHFRNDVKNLSDDIENVVSPAIESLENASGSQITPISLMPAWADLGEQIGSTNMTISHSGMEYSQSYGTWRMIMRSGSS